MRVPSWRPAAAMLAGALTIAALTPTSAVAQPAQDRQRGAAQEWLLVADTVAEQVYVVGADSGQVTGTLSNVELGTHAGTLQLGGGKVAFMDESKPELDVVKVNSAGVPRIIAHYPIPNPDGEWERAGWMAADPTHRYVAVGSDFDGSTTQQATIVDLRTGRSHTAELTVSAVQTPSGLSNEEMEVFLVGQPLRLVVSAGGHLDAYRVSDIMAGRSHPKAFARTALSAYPHGPIVSADGTVVGSTVALGHQTVRITKSGFGASAFSLYPRPSVESYRPAMAPDGTTALGSHAGATEVGTTWDQTPAYLTIGSTRRAGLRTVVLGEGSATRVTPTDDYAAVALTSGSGDKLLLLKRNTRTDAYTGGLKSVALEPLENGPVAGEPTTGKATRYLTATPDGDHVFVTRGGEGTITEIDVTGTKPVSTRTITVPSALSNGGYLITIDANQKPYDLVAR
ncbi:MAG: hypothetical protein QM714_06805 [Nocardioides sp.]|uniref:hypothetical protein n=1 Tax=Nocardioides sp. TaxID=35761 RepID=UPI0039E4ED58